MKTPEFTQTIRQQIAEFGRSIFLVNYDYCSDCDEVHAMPGEWPYAFTIGNHVRSLPELILFGLMTEEASRYYLHDLSEKMIRQRHSFKDGSLHSVDGTLVMVINASHAAHENYMEQAGSHLRTDRYRVQQVLLPDDYNRYPGDPQMHGDHATVPVLRLS